MKLDRNQNPPRGKYALIKLRESTITTHLVAAAMAAGKPVEVEPMAIDFGNSDDTDFFVIRLKDKYTEAALLAYADAVGEDDREYAREIYKLAALASMHPNKRKPD